ncbi:hypothetical protein SBRY_20209 [Actinacidiphila bryophytorum]|uniref:Uncharacterized protein n=1 Tax=Actinacidiphila bryophytorum TaxID=1436133 RepID=A0A9W4E3J8_9ACTN|nr:hypothetical protein SBRY_20209 [Actinacidiphila bryophytorum]
MTLRVGDCGQPQRRGQRVSVALRRRVGQRSGIRGLVRLAGVCEWGWVYPPGRSPREPGKRSMGTAFWPLVSGCPYPRLRS